MKKRKIEGYLNDYSKKTMYERSHPSEVKKIIAEIKRKDLSEQFEYLSKTFYMEGWEKMSDSTFNDVDVFFSDILNLKAIYVRKDRELFEFEDDRTYQLCEEIRYLLVGKKDILMKNYFRNVYMRKISDDELEEYKITHDYSIFKNKDDVYGYLQIKNLMDSL